MNTDLIKKGKNDLYFFFKLEKLWKIVRKHREIKLVTRERRRNYPVQNQIILLQNVLQKIY